MENKKKKMLAVTTEFVFLSFRHTCTLIQIHTHETRIHKRSAHTHTHTHVHIHAYMESIWKYICAIYFFVNYQNSMRIEKTIYTDNIHVHVYKQTNTIPSSVYIVFVEYRFCRRRGSVNYFPSISNERARAYCNHTGDRMMTRF